MAPDRLFFMAVEENDKKMVLDLAPSKKDKYVENQGVNVKLLEDGGPSMFKSTAHRFRRFGVLCFAYSEPEARRPKLGTRFTRGAFWDTQKSTPLIWWACGED